MLKILKSQSIWSVHCFEAKEKNTFCNVNGMKNIRLKFDFLTYHYYFCSDGSVKAHVQPFSQSYLIPLSSLNEWNTLKLCRSQNLHCVTLSERTALFKTDRTTSLVGVLRGRVVNGANRTHPLYN